MQGDYTYCIKHGHDYQPIGCTPIMVVCKCSICGAVQVTLI